MLLVLLAVEGVTVLQVRQLLTPHVFIGMVLIPPVLVKVASTTWRFARYYRGAPAYKRKGPPPVVLRLLGPVVVVLTVVLLASGVGLMLVGQSWLPLLLKVHKASFVLWFGAMTIHVLGHLGEVFRLAPRDWLRRTRREVTGAGLRQWLIAGSLVVGVLLGFLLVSRVGPWLRRRRTRVTNPGPSHSEVTAIRRSAGGQHRLERGPQRSQAPGGGLAGGLERAARERLDDLDVALDLRLGAARPQHHARQRQPEDQHVGPRHRGRAAGRAPVGQVQPAGHGLVTEGGRRCRPELAHDVRLVGRPQGELGGQVHAVRPLQVVINRKDRTALRFRPLRQLEHRQRGADSVLVAHHVADGVAEGLLVAEDETRPRHAGRPPGRST